MPNKDEYIIKGPRLSLRQLTLADVNEQYLGWLNDQEIQKYTRRRGQTMTMDELRNFIRDSAKSKDWHLAIIITKENKHIGNIFLNLVDKLNKSADLSIMIGDRDEWGKGYAKEAIELMTEFAFTKLDLHRLYAGSPNPAFNSLIEKLGWVKEGCLREAFWLEGKFIDMVCWSILKPEWEKNGKDIA